jgi:hypothetical protein
MAPRPGKGRIMTPMTIPSMLRALPLVVILSGGGICIFPNGLVVLSGRINVRNG